MAKRPDPEPTKVTRRLMDVAEALPGVEPGTSCVNLAYRAKGKAFFYLGHKANAWNGRLKLTDSFKEAERLAKKEPGIYEPGKIGWVKFTFANDAKPPKGLLERWIEESFRNLAPKGLVRALDETSAKDRGRARKA